ncbi:hypothetical protein PG984_009877 [Apiospora sp. TS-2023a]
MTVGPSRDLAAALAVNRALGAVLKTVRRVHGRALDGPGAHLLAVLEDVQDHLAVERLHVDVGKSLHARHLFRFRAEPACADVRDNAPAASNPAAPNGHILSGGKETKREVGVADGLSDSRVGWARRWRDHTDLVGDARAPAAAAVADGSRRVSGAAGSAVRPVRVEGRHGRAGAAGDADTPPAAPVAHQGWRIRSASRRRSTW